MTTRSQPHDRRIHADALRQQYRKSQWDRFKRQVGIMAASVALGAVAVPYVMLDEDRTDAIAAYATAKVKLAATFGRNADAPISIRFQGRYRDTVENVEEQIDEVWHLERNLTQPDSPWHIVGIQQ